MDYFKLLLVAPTHVDDACNAQRDRRGHVHFAFFVSQKKLREGLEKSFQCFPHTVAERFFSGKPLVWLQRLDVDAAQRLRIALCAFTQKTHFFVGNNARFFFLPLLGFLF